MSSSTDSQNDSQIYSAGVDAGADAGLAKIILPAHFDSLDQVREFVARHAEAYGLNEDETYKVELAVDEAFSNIVEHAYGGECDEKIECTCQITQEGLEIVMRDCGRPFDPGNVPAPDLESDLEERQIGGLGLYFIRQLMDHVEFSFVHQLETGKGCNTIKMVKRKEG